MDKSDTIITKHRGFFITEQSQNEQQKSNQKMIIDLEKQLKELKKLGLELFLQNQQKQ